MDGTGPDEKGSSAPPQEGVAMQLVDGTPVVGTAVVYAQVPVTQQPGEPSDSQATAQQASAAGATELLPDLEFTSTNEIGCCAIAITEYGSKYWYTCQQSVNLICIRGQGACLKPYDDKFYARFESASLVTPPDGFPCDYYCQCMMIHLFCCNTKDKMQETAKIAPVVVNAEFDKTTDVVACNGACCTVDSCNCKFPQCLGCVSKSVLLCLASQSIACHPTCWDEQRDEQTLCILSKTGCWVETPKVLCKNVCHNFCCDHRSALPCDDEVPCICFGCMFCTLCVNFNLNVKCCATITELTRKD